MTHLEETIQKARSRLTLDRWFNNLTIGAMVAAGAFAAFALIVRLFGWNAPLDVAAIAALVGAIIVATVWTLATRLDLPTAAAALDEAAGLRERLSSGLYCEKTDDPFERAVRSDAERTSRTITPSQHLRLHTPKRLGSAALAVLLAAAMVLVPSGLLVGEEERDEDEVLQAQRVAAVIKKRTQRIKRVAPTNAELKKISDDLDKLGEAPDGKLRTPSEMRRAALKKLDNMQDALKRQRASNKFEHAKEFKKMLRGLKHTPKPDNPTAKLAKALAAGDFKSAREQLLKMKKQLAEAKNPQDAQLSKAMQEKLAELAKKLEALANDEKLKNKLAQIGLKPEDIERMLKNLTPEDMEKIRQQLQKQGLSQKDADDLMKQLQKRSGANQMANQLAQALQQAAAAMGQGQMGQASSEMGAAAGMLSEMEMLEQDMNAIDAMMADMQSARNDLSKPCSSCNGTGQSGKGQCGSCNGSGTGSGQGRGGMGPNPGQGRGGIAQEQATRDGFQKHRQKVHIGAGATIGQSLVKGEQHKGEVVPALKELVAAAEKDATDAIDRARIPRRYHKAVKNYFSDLHDELGDATTPPTESDSE